MNFLYGTSPFRVLIILYSYAQILILNYSDLQDPFSLFEIMIVKRIPFRDSTSIDDIEIYFHVDDFGYYTMYAL